MYQPQIGDRIKFTGYTPEAYRNGSVPTFFGNEGIVIEVEGKLYLKLDSEYIIPLYYLDNIECIKPTKTCKYFVENAEKCLAHLTQRNSCHTNYGCIFYKEVDLTKTEFKPKRVIEQDLTPEEEYYYSMDGSSISEKCNGCDMWDDMSGTPPHCRLERCIKTFTEEDACYLQLAGKPPIPRIKEESFFGNQQFQNEDTRMETCQYYSDYNQCAMGHYDEDRNVFCAVCLICDDYKKKEEKTHPIRRT